MKFPAINKQPKRRARVPELSGGLNQRDGITQCSDNQLTEVLNMWYKDGYLRTRPGTMTLGTIDTIAYDESITPRRTDICIDEQWLFYCSISGSRRDSTDIATVTFTETIFWLQGIGSPKKLSTLSGMVSFVTMKDGVLYSFMTERKIYKLDIDKNATEWLPVPEEDYYVPLVIADCKFVQDGGMHPRQMDVIASGVMYEGYNLLGDYYKMEYSMYNYEYATEDTSHIAPYHLMYYGLLNDVFQNNKYVGKIVKAVITLADGTTSEHSVKITAHSSAENEPIDIEENVNKIDYMKMAVTGNAIKFCDSNGNERYVFEGEFPDNNLLITAPYIPENRTESLDKIFQMSRCEWFGGGAKGLAGGTRLFLCGNTNENEKALVCWSGLNEPLYFSENSYFYVGDTSSAVTGFGKQENTLVIFKEREVWYTVYRQAESIEAADLINQRVLDIQTSAVYFPLTQIHSTIGCKYPDTVQLCRNRLVWLSGDRKVYTLTSQNQYSERNIYCVSGMINKSFVDEPISKLVFAADWEGHYLLFIDNHVYAMDYNSYGYTHIYSYSKTEDAEIKIPWWYWEFEDKRPISSISINNELCIIFYPEEPSGYISHFKIKVFNRDYGFDDDIPINSMVQTKFFDFGEPNIFKSIPSVAFALGYNGGNEISIGFITDGGEEHTAVFLDDATAERSAAFIKSTTIMPAISSVLRMGLKFECEGSMIIEGITIDYRMLGRAR